jgi:hypothetical protein
MIGLRAASLALALTSARSSSLLTSPQFPSPTAASSPCSNPVVFSTVAIPAHEQVWIEFQVQGGTLHSDDRVTLRALARARTQAAVIPTQDGVDEQPRDGAEQLTVEGQAATN